LGAFIHKYHDAILALFTVILAFSTILLWLSTRDLFRAAETQALLTQRIFVSTERPWMSVVSATAGQLTVTPEQSTLIVRFILKNTGKTPAMDVNLFAELFVYTKNERSDAAALEGVVQRTLSLNKKSGETFFPGDERGEMELGAVNAQRGLVITRAAIEASYPPAEKVNVAIVGCVIYRFTFEEGQHFTPFIFHGFSIPKAEGRYTLNDVGLPGSPTHISPT
jgi:hypothetical protein